MFPNYHYQTNIALQNECECEAQSIFALTLSREHSRDKKSFFFFFKWCFILQIKPVLPKEQEVCWPDLCWSMQTWGQLESILMPLSLVTDAWGLGMKRSSIESVLPRDSRCLRRKNVVPKSISYINTILIAEFLSTSASCSFPSVCH